MGKAILVCGNLNMHVPEAFYEAFPSEQAKNLPSQLEIHCTPNHGSQLNIAEIELIILTRQCLNRRLPTLETLRAEAASWNRNRNQTQMSVNWRFTTSDARRKLKRLCPVI